MMRFISNTIFLLISISLFGQENVNLINSHRNDMDKNDINQVYINKTTEKIIKLDSTYFNLGFVIKSGDTLNCKIYLKRNKLNNDMYLYVLAKFDNDDSVHVLTGKDINGYIVKGEIFMSHCLDQKSYSFIRLIESGKIILYDRNLTPINSEYIYLFKRQGEKSFSILAPFTENIEYYHESSNHEASRNLFVSTNNMDDQFKNAFKSYFSDCPKIARSISNGFYTIKDFKTIIEEYNEKCN